ncbi:OmpP1/FadL family transporter [Coralliovum pocilloporae]|uniref:OmpP1/FadL family transporter n=1 Tax=Coralliovum pocilloporae TaxID=3066369 RepID=UPI003306BEF3
MRRIRAEHGLATLLSGVALVSTLGMAEAGSFALREQSATGQGSSFAGVAANGSGISSIFWNPATLSQAGEGITTESHYSVILPNSDFDVDPTGTTLANAPFNLGGPGDIGRDGLVGSSYAAYRLNDDVVLGFALNAPFGLRTKANPNGSGQTFSRTNEVLSLYGNPIVSYQINDQVSVAVGGIIAYFDARLTNSLGPTNGTLELEGDDIGFGGTAGITFKPFEGTELGLGYRSPVSFDLEGDLTAGAPFNGQTGIRIDDVTLPEIVTFSFRQTITEEFDLLGTVEWTNWSRFGSFPVQQATTVIPADLAFEFNYDDGWYFALGGEYRYNEKLTLRAGAAWEISPIDTEIRGLRIPDDDRLWLSAGMSYQYSDQLGFDLGYSYITTFDTEVLIGPGHQDFAGVSFAADVDADVHILSAAMKYKW